MIDWEKLMALKQAMDKANEDLDKALEEVWEDVEDRAVMTTVANRWRRLMFGRNPPPPTREVTQPARDAIREGKWPKKQ